MKLLPDDEIDRWKGQHIPYRLKLLDGLRWWCEFKKSGRDELSITLSVNGQIVSATLLTNGIAESGLMACRFLLDFMGLQPAPDNKSPTGFDLDNICDKSRREDDVWARRIRCEPAKLEDFSTIERQACGYTHKVASRGVGHPTTGPEGANLDWLLLCATAVERTVVREIYSGSNPTRRSLMWTIAPIGLASGA